MAGMKFDDLSAEDQNNAKRAVVYFLKINDYQSLMDACERRSIDGQTLWNEIMQDAGIPENEMPEKIQRR